MSDFNHIRREEMSEIGRAYYLAANSAARYAENFQMEVQRVQRDLQYLQQRVQMVADRGPEALTVNAVDCATEIAGAVAVSAGNLNLNYFQKAAADLAMFQGQARVLAPLVDVTEKARIDALVVFMNS